MIQPSYLCSGWGSWIGRLPTISSNPARNRYGTPFPTQDIEIGILGERNGHKALEALLMFLFQVDDAEWEWRAHGTQIH